MEIILSFATEVANSPVDHGVIKAIAEILSDLNVTGNFHLTGDYARALRKTASHDVVAALRNHEIGYHCDHHGARPFMLEYVEGKGWDEGVRDWLANELPGARVVEAVIGKTPTYYTTEFAAAAQVVRGSYLAGLGITGYLPAPTRDHGATWYCGSFVPSSARLMDLECGLNDNFIETKRKIFDHYEREMQTTPSNLLRVIAHVYRYYADYPQVSVSFRDAYQRGDRHYENTPAFTAFSDSVIRGNLDKFKTMIEWMRDRDDVEFLSFSEYRARFRDNADVWLDQATLTKAAVFYAERLDAFVTDEISLSPAEAFSLFVRALRIWRENGALPETICVRDALGPLSPSLASDSGVTVPVAPFLDALRPLDLRLDDAAITPSDVVADDQVIGPGDFLKLMAMVYLSLESGNAIPESIKTLGVNLPDIAAEPFFQETTFVHSDKDGKSLYPEGFTGEDVCRTRRLQSWTWKPALRR